MPTSIHYQKYWRRCDLFDEKVPRQVDSLISAQSVLRLG